MTNKKFKVSLTRYPEEFEIEAENATEAVRIAKEQFRGSVWESEVEEIEKAGVITANHNSKKEKLAKLLELAKKLEDKPVVIPEREHFIDSDGKKIYLPMDYPEISLEEHNWALFNYYDARDRAKGKIWKVNCKKCGVEMEACDGFEPLLCANCVFGYKKCARSGCDNFTKNLYCSLNCKDYDDAMSAQEEAEWDANEQNQVIGESEI